VTVASAVGPGTSVLVNGAVDLVLWRRGGITPRATRRLPPRDYRLAAELLARAAAADPAGTVARALREVAADLGRELVITDAGNAADLVERLANQGFEPY
jgi:hypothetical protein